MKHNTLLFVILMLLSVTCFSQKIKLGADLSEVRLNKNHLEVDVKNVFRGLGNATILYKRSFNVGNLIDVNSIKLFRFSGRINNQITITDDPTRASDDTTNAVYHPSDILNFQVGIGYEKQKMKGKFVHYHGLDFIVNYFKNDDDYTNAGFGGITNNATQTTDRFIETIRTGFNPFFGIKFYFTKRLSLGLETGISLLYFRQSITEVGFENVFVDGQLEEQFVEEEPVISHGLQTNFNNLRFVTFGYTF